LKTTPVSDHAAAGFLTRNCSRISSQLQENSRFLKTRGGD